MRLLIALLPALFLCTVTRAGCEFSVWQEETIGNVFGVPRERGSWTVVQGGEIVASVIRSPAASASPPPRVERCPEGRGRAYLVPSGLARGDIHHDDQRAEMIASIEPTAIAQVDYEGDLIRMSVPLDAPAALDIVATTLGESADPSRPQPIIGLDVYPLTVLEAHSAEAAAFVLYRDAFLAMNRGDVLLARRLSEALVALRPTSAQARLLAAGCADRAGDRKSALAHVEETLLILTTGISDDVAALDQRYAESLLRASEEQQRIFRDGWLPLATSPGSK